MPPMGALDPRRANKTASGKLPQRFVRRISQATHKFGYAPDMSAPRPGDVVLTRARAAIDIGGHILDFAQRRKASPDAAFWSHAALYLGDNLVVEAVPSAIRIGNLTDYVPSHFLDFRTLDSLTDQQRYEICIQACSKIGQPYSRAQIVKIAKHILLDLNPAQLEIDVEDEYICSHLIFESYLFAINLGIATPGAAKRVRPADLAETQLLSKPTVGWVKI